uniref:Uncharacterized protein n=1 Tax=Monopterus albus TaxID=43700 RepID=A0A3Q3IWH5_MONAL
MTNLTWILLDCTAASETKGHKSAVERLAASKPKYVKSQQVVNSTQELVISPGSPSGTNSTVGIQICSPGQVGQVRQASSKKRRDSLLLYRQKCDLLKGAANDQKFHMTPKLLLSSVKKNVPLPETDKDGECEGNEKKNTTPKGTAKESSLYLVTSQSERRRNKLAEQHSTESNNSGTKVRAGLLTVPEVERSSGKGVSRSHSDISSRYSKNFADFDAFFKYCGLDGEVIESLGKENFSARSDEIEINIRSVSVSTSDGGFSENSGDSDGLLDAQLQEKVQQGTSVIERNARIIKWLYSCKNAIETGKTLRDLD